MKSITVEWWGCFNTIIKTITGLMSLMLLKSKYELVLFSYSMIVNLLPLILDLFDIDKKITAGCVHNKYK